MADRFAIPRRAWSGLSSLPTGGGSVLTVGMAGDSQVSVGNSGTDANYDSLTLLPSNCTVERKGTTLTGGISMWPEDNNGLSPYLLADLQGAGGVETVRIIDRSVSGAFWETIEDDQLHDMAQDALTAGWTPDVLILWGWTNNAGGTYPNSGDQATDITQALVARQYREACWRARGYWPNVNIVLIGLPNADTWQADTGLIRAAAEAEAAVHAGVYYCDLWDGGPVDNVLVMADDKHGDTDHATKGYAAVAPLIRASMVAP